MTATFGDGTTEVGSMAIGCDGSHSKVREFLVGHEAAKLEDTMINYAAGNYSPEEAHVLRSYHPILKLCWHPVLPGGSLLAGMYRLSRAIIKNLTRGTMTAESFHST